MQTSTAFSRWAAGLLWLPWALILSAGCQPWQTNTVGDRLLPSNFRDWSPEYAQLPRTEVHGRQLTIHNIRNNQYLTDEDFAPTYYDRTIDLDEVQSVDFVVVPFKQMPSMAHTMLSFGLADGSYLGVSAEIRTEKGESYSPLLGMSNQFELTYVVADERDLIRLRTRHRGADVYVYPTIANAQQAQQLFLDCMLRANQLAEHPEFYHTIANNCTTNILAHVNRLRNEQIPHAWEILLPGHSDRFAYELGLLDTSVTFEQLKQLAHVNRLAERHYDDPQFSQLIRTRIARAQTAPEVPTEDPPSTLRQASVLAEQSVENILKLLR